MVLITFILKVFDLYIGKEYYISQKNLQTIQNIYVHILTLDIVNLFLVECTLFPICLYVFVCSSS